MKHWISIVVFAIGLTGAFQVKSQTTTYTEGNFTIEVTPVHPCDGSDNGAIQFKIISADGGAANLVIVGSDFPGEIISVGSTYTWTDPDLATEAGTYEFVIRENIPPGPTRDFINTTTTPAPDGIELVALSDIVINQETLTNNSSCSSPNGQVVASIDGGSKTPALAPTAGSFNYTWSSNNGFAGLPFSDTYDGMSDLDLVDLLGVSGLPAGTYTLLVEDNYSTCSATRDFVLTDPSPLSFNVSTSTPAVCLGGGGLVELSNSESSAVNYQIYLNGSPTTINQNGNGGALSFAIPAGTLSAAGSYNFTIRAVNGLCTPAFMNGTAVITVVSPPTAANAGPDQLSLCGVTSTNLAANSPTIGTGAWSVVSGSGGSFANSASPTSSFSGTAGATYVLRWTISNAPCTASTDDVTITFNQNPTTSNAGPDQLSLCGVTSTTLAGNTPAVGTGAWSIVSGTGGSLGTASSPTSSFSGTLGTTYVLRWTISNAPCTSSTDDVTITFNPNPTTSNAGLDQLNLCGVTSTALAANAPTVGTGAWSIVSGTGGSFGNSASPTSSFSGTAGTTYTLRWTITNTPCTPSTDDVTITFNQNPTTANAGPDQLDLCTTSATLAANTPTVGTGAWSIVSGAGGSFGNTASPISSFSGTAGTSYVLRWTIDNAPCTASTDDVTITFNIPPTTSNAGPDQLNLCGVTSTTLAANAPTVGTGAWSVVSGAGGSFGNSASPTSDFTGTLDNTYVLRWTISSAPCTSSTDDVTVTLNQNPTSANAGPDQLNLCGITSTTLAANAPTVGTGAWSIASGTGGSFGNSASPTSSFSGTAGTTYTLRWTISNAPCTASTDDVTITFNLNPTTSNAGPDQLNLCTTSTTLAANAPTTGTGAWSIVSGSGGSFGNSASPTSSFSGTAGTSYVLRWTIINAPCTASTDDVTITFNNPPTTSNAGPDQLNLCGVTSAALAANTPTIGTGAWSIVSGAGGSFANSASPTSNFNGTLGTTYVLRWTISNAPCAASTDDVTITFNPNPTAANAGPDQLSLCGVTSTNLAANTPTVGTGAWSIVSGTGGSFGNSASPTSSFAGTVGSTYVLRWTISSAPCTPSTDDVTVTFNQNPTTSNAGPDQLNLCGVTSTALAANTPIIGTGGWSVVSGTGGSFTDATNPTTSFSGIAGVTYSLRWTISNVPCTASTDDVTITFNQNPTTSNAGPDQLNLCGVTSTTLAANAPTAGTGAWSIVSGTGGSFGNTASATSSFNGTAGSTYTLRWTISNAPCTASTDDVTITFNQNPTTANAGSDQLNLCGVTNATLAANSATVGTGAWSIVSGTGGSFGNSASPTSSFTGTAGTTYTLRWTITNAPCTPSEDDVTVIFNQNPSSANAGSDQLTICGVATATMAANTPAIGTGAWSVVSGSGGSFADASNPTSTFNGTIGTTYILRWTITNAPCTASTDDVTIVFNQNPSLTFTKTDVSGCVPGNDGSITVTASGGNGSYEYSKDGGATFQPGNVFNTLVSGNYDVVVRDGISCLSATTTVTIGSPAGLSATTASVDVICNGGNNGSITVSASGGNGSYTYSKDNGGSFQSGNVFSSLTAGTYDIVVLDGGGCQFTTLVTINEPAAVSLALASTNITCNGDDDGSITISAAGGNGTYTYSKDGGSSFQGSNVFSSLTPGPYSIQVRDGNACLSAITVVNISEPAVVSLTSSKTDATTCSPANDGSINITAFGGSGPYEYSVDNGANFQISNSFTGLTPATYTLLVRDANGCLSVTSNVTIGTPGAVSFTSVVNDAACNGASNGSIAITASGGNGVYSYSINNGGSFQSGSSFTGLAPATYPTVVRDGNNCLSPVANLVVSEPSAVTFTTSKTDATACGASDGSIVVTPSGGTANYFASIDNGASFTGPNTAFTFNGLAAGSYNVIVRDQNNCQTSATAVNILAPGSLSFSSVNQNVSCFGGNNGSISITASGGSGIYSYSKDNGTTFQPSNLFASLSAGTYDIVVDDGAGCQFVSAITITQPRAISAAVSSTNLTCNGSGDGSISVAASGGSGTLQYSIDNGASYQAGSAFTGLAAGSYTILVRDANSCLSAATVVNLTEPTAVTFTSTPANPTGCGVSDGSIAITPSGGNGTYFASIDNGATFSGPLASFTFNGLSSGSYNVIVRDGNNCLSAVSNIVLNSAGGLSATFTKTDVLCFGQSTGTISISASGGSGVYEYSIDGTTFLTSGLFTGLPAGTYPVTARDNASCTFSASVTINQAAAVAFTTTNADVLCNGGNTGSITVTASGGNGLFTYSSNNGGSYQASNILGGLTAGSYSVIVKDGNNCLSSVSSVSIAEPSILSFTTSSNDATTCTPGNDGSITVTANGGSSGYQYSSDGGSTYQGSNIFNGLSVGSYSVMVTDGNGCTTSASSVTIANPASPDATFSGLAASYCNTNANVTLTPMVTGGTFSGTGISGNVFSPSTAGVGTFNIQYSITVNGCTSSTTQSVTVTTSTVDASFTGLNFVYCANATSSTLTPTTAGGTFSGSGITGNVFDPAVAGAGQHTIEYTVTSGGCTGTTSKVVTVLLATDPLCTGSVGTGTCATVVITPVPSPATCTNSDGSIMFNIVPFVPLINNTGVRISIVGVSITNQTVSRTNFNDPAFAGLPVGTYDYSIEYGDPSCIKTGQVTIDQSGTVGTPVASNIVRPTCAGANTGSVVIDVPGETGNTLEWSIDGVTWTPFTSGTAITGLTQGPSPSFQHLISVRRNSGDPCNGGVLVTMQDVAGAITFSNSVTNATCSNNDGTIQIGTISGGTEPYSYSFNGTPLTAMPANDTFTTLAAGTYAFVVYDVNGCSRTENITVNFPGVVDVTAVALNPDCSSNGLNGAIAVTINSVGNFNIGLSTDMNTPPTSFQNVTSNGTAVVNFNNRSKGTYYITTQSTGLLCPVTTTVSILGGPTAVDFAAVTQDVACFEDLGVIHLTGISGQAGLAYGYEIVMAGSVVKSGAITALEAIGPVDIIGINQGVYQIRLFQNQPACTAPIFSGNKPLVIDGPDAKLDTIAVAREISLPDRASGVMNIVVAESGKEPYEFRLELIDPLFDEQSMPAIDWTQMDRSSQTLKIEREVGELFAGQYKLSIRDGFGCVREYDLVIGLNTDLFIPNLFTPNGDDANEEFYIRNLPENSKLFVTDRWGKEIFTSNNYKNDWRGGNSPDGVYYYKVIIGDETIAGWVEILRGQ